MDSSLLSAWVQSDFSSGSRKTWEFGPDGSYRFMLIVAGQVVQQEEGTFTAEEATLTLAPTGGPERSLGWTIDKDPYVGDTRLVLEGSDIYYRQ